MYWNISIKKPCPLILFVGSIAPGKISRAQKVFSIQNNCIIDPNLLASTTSKNNANNDNYFTCFVFWRHRLTVQMVSPWGEASPFYTMNERGFSGLFHIGVLSVICFSNCQKRSGVRPCTNQSAPWTKNNLWNSVPWLSERGNSPRELTKDEGCGSALVSRYAHIYCQLPPPATCHLFKFFSSFIFITLPDSTFCIKNLAILHFRYLHEYSEQLVCMTFHFNAYNLLSH